MFSTKPKIRTKTVAVPVKKSTAPNAAAPPANRYSLTPSIKVRAPASSQQPQKQREPARKSLSVSRVQQKRKVSPSTPQWASSDESSDDDDADDRLGVRKRQKMSSSIEPPAMNRCLLPDPKRRVRIHAAADDAPQEANKAAKLIPGLKMTRGEWVKKFKPAFAGSKENRIVELQYPSSSRPEKFETVVPRDESDFSPVNDIYFCIEEIIQHYLPPSLAMSLSSETDGTVRLLKRAVAKNSPDDFEAALNDFNTLIRKRLNDGTIPKVLDEMHAIPLSLTKRILAQVYQRTVSPHAHLLRKVKGKETTYGELLPPFVHNIFDQTSLNSSCVFVDLGSGVGNVVLQSALQTGAESWGIEIMDTPASFADRQASELRARAKLWNISLGPITLLHGDFLESPEVDEVLRRADVVLVNNKVFPQKLNGALLDKFLDLKHGCKVVSLESFGGGNKQGVRNEQSIANLFDEERFDSGTNSVSWAGESVEYFIATKAR
ncbi:histone-lysine N-methyltransferas-like protein [Corynespora cassiicola Philippines]|uniref:Histone-lysine N-methyltransferase, H3 lysine-79 specific n=1 Tax=Corynespora cassiicola Philippines TaxID=1448308 RepID=A0A2T2NM86_CORCC|nr:histone-lysine N-methyltransferas-like protein [Corynespora cassiicola Philippines]